MEDSTTDAAVSEERTSDDLVQAPEDSEEGTGAEEERSATSEEDSPSPELDKFDVNNLSPELQKEWKEMKAAFTKDKQLMSELRKKAQMYDQAQQEELLRQKFPTAETPSKTTTANLIERMGIDPNQLDENQFAFMQSLSQAVEGEVAARIQESITPIQNDLLSRDYRQELNDVRKKYGDFDQYKPEIKAMLQQNPQMGFEQAYKIASFDDQGRKGRTEAIKNLEVKKRQASPKSTSNAKADDDYIKGDWSSLINWAKTKVGQSK